MNFNTLMAELNALQVIDKNPLITVNGQLLVNIDYDAGRKVINLESYQEELEVPQLEVTSEIPVVKLDL